MLYGKLWIGLRDDLKDVSGYKYDIIEDFNKLQIVLRQIEKDYKKLIKLNIFKVVIVLLYEDEQSKFIGMMDQLI